MSSDEPTPPRRFVKTDWGLVGQAGEGRREALGVLLLRYLPALRAYLMQRGGLTCDNADDILQEFVASKILQGEAIAHARRNEGKFRTFLLKTLNRFVINRMRDRQTKKRAPQHGRIVSLGDHLELLGSERQPADAFHAAWAQEALREALRRMQVQCERSGRADLWAVFQCRVAGPILEGKEPVSYEHLIERFGFRSPSQASNALITAKRMYARTLRAVLAEYARDEEEVEEEIRELREALSRHRPS